MKSLDEIEQALKAKAAGGDAEAKRKLDEFYLKRTLLQKCERAARLYRMIALFVNEEFIGREEAQRLLSLIQSDPDNVTRIQEELRKAVPPGVSVD